MSKLFVDVLIIALNKIEFDARLSNFIYTFQNEGLKVGTITIDCNEYFLPNVSSFFIPLNENRRAYLKTFLFNLKGLKFVDTIFAKNIICSDVYSLPLGIKFKKKCNANLIYDSREIYSALSSLSSKPFKQEILSFIERHYVHLVDSIVVTGDLDKDYLSKVFPTKPFQVIYNYPRKIEKTDIVDVRKQLCLGKNTVLSIYQGMLLEGRGIEIVLNSLRFDESLNFIIAGSGAMENKFKNIAKSLKVENRIHFVGKLPYNKLLNLTMGCDVGICLIEPLSLSYELALPNKLFEYIQSGIPTIATRLPAIEKIFAENKIGELVNSKIYPEELSQMILSVAKNKEQYLPDIKKCSDIFIWENQNKTILNLLR